MVIKERWKCDSVCVCVKDGKFRLLNGVWLSPVGNRDGSQTKLASPSFISAWFISSQPVSVRKTRARQKASWGDGVWRESGSGALLRDSWRCLEKSRAAAGRPQWWGRGEALGEPSHAKPSRKDRTGQWFGCLKVIASGWRCSPGPPIASPRSTRGARRCPKGSQGHGCGRAERRWRCPPSAPAARGIVRDALKSRIPEVSLSAAVAGRGGLAPWGPKPRPSHKGRCHSRLLWRKGQVSAFKAGPGVCWCRSTSFVCSLAFAKGGRDPWLGASNGKKPNRQQAPPWSLGPDPS